MSTIKIHNIETGEIIERDMTPDELLILKSAQQEALAKTEAEIAKAEAKAELLKKLGITEEEAKLLLS